MDIPVNEIRDLIDMAHCYNNGAEQQSIEDTIVKVEAWLKDNIPLWMSAHPDAEVPEDIWKSDVWEDESYKNDAQPSFRHKHSHVEGKAYFRLTVDYKDKNMRDLCCVDYHRFQLYYAPCPEAEDQFDMIMIWSSDNLDELLAMQGGLTIY